MSSSITEPVIAHIAAQLRRLHATESPSHGADLMMLAADLRRRRANRAAAQPPIKPSRLREPRRTDSQRPPSPAGLRHLLNSVNTFYENCGNRLADHWLDSTRSTLSDAAQPSTRRLEHVWENEGGATLSVPPTTENAPDH